MRPGLVVWGDRMPAFLSTAHGPDAMAKMMAFFRKGRAIAFPRHFDFYQERIPGARPGSFAIPVEQASETYFEVG